MIILGVDPGSLITGYGFVEVEGNHFQVLEAGALRLKRAGEMGDRLLLLATELETRVRKHKPDVLSLEKVFLGKNFQTALVLGYVRGVVLMLCARYKLKIAEYTATQVKKTITGFGRAEKVQVQEVVRILLNLAEIPKPADKADALALALCHAHTAPTQNRYAVQATQPAQPGGRRVWRGPT